MHSWFSQILIICFCIIYNVKVNILIASIKNGKLINSENASNTQRSGPYPKNRKKSPMSMTSTRIFYNIHRGKILPALILKLLKQQTKISHT